MSTVPRLIHEFVPDHYSLSLDIDRLARTFRGTVTIRGEVVNEQLRVVLHSHDLTIEAITADGHTADWQPLDDSIAITSDQLTPGAHEVSVSFRGTITDSMHGMYPCYFDHGGVKKELIATQFESHHAREVFPCVDEPEAKATFDVTLTTESGVTVLGNMPVASQTTAGDRLITTFETTPRMSSYLLAWVYGELHSKTAHTTSGVEVNVWATPAQSAESLDFALDHSVRVIEFFDDYFQTAYPLPKVDHVALPDFSSAAMENWGLITYRESCLLVDPASTSFESRQYIASVVSHELSHQWFGNLVTMRWWNNLWLNESFATLMSSIADDALHPEWDVWLEFSASEVLSALRRDCLDGVQAVQVEVNHPDEIGSLFDPSIVYAKGARLMRMCQAHIGHEAFRAGLASYFAEFAYGNTEADDLWRHLSAASGQDISHLMNFWIATPGYPVVTVRPDGLRQERFFIGPHESSATVWPIPLCAESDEDVPALLETRELRLLVADTERLNTGDTSHFITDYTEDHLERLLTADLDAQTRMQLLHEQTLLVRGGRVPSARLVDLLLHYRHEANSYVWDIMAVAFGELKKFVETDEAAEAALRKLAHKLAHEQYALLGWDPRADETEDTTKLRPTIIGMMLYAEDPDVSQQAASRLAAGIDSVAPELRSLVISSVVRHSSNDDIVHELLDQYVTTSSPDRQSDILGGITAARRPSAIKFLLNTLTDTKIVRPQDNAHWFVYLLRNRYARDATWQWMRDQWGWITEQFGSDKSFDYFPRYAASGLATREQYDQYVEFFSPLRDSEPALKRVIDLGIVEIDARLDLLDRDGDAVRARLLEL